MKLPNQINTALDAYTTQHRDGLRVVFRQDTHVTPPQIKLEVIERRDGEFYDQRFVISTESTPYNYATLQREEALLDAVCDYINAGGACASLESFVSCFKAFAAEVATPADTVRGKLARVAEVRDRVVYYHLDTGDFLKVVEDQYVEVLTPQGMFDETGGDVGDE